MQAPSKTLATAVVAGTGALKADLSVSYKGQELRAAQLEERLDAWASVGTMEPDCAAAAKEGAKRVGSLRGRTFLVLGAGSELGPVRLLLEAGATVAAVATKRKERWTDLLRFARQTAGKLLVPYASGSPADDEALTFVAGANLLTEAPEIAQWFLKCAREATGPVTLGTYLYADGEANVRLTAAADFIAETLATALGKTKVSFAWLASPSTVTVIPNEAVEAQAELFGEASWWQRMAGKPQDCPQVEGTDIRLFNGLEVMQGPNYALAQSMRQWRAILLHLGGFVVSTPVTPMCRTESVCHNRTMATVLDGVAYIVPLEAFEPATCRAIMFALLAKDLSEPPPRLQTPFHLVAREAFHSGLWRCPFVMASLGTSTWCLGRLAPKQNPQ